MGNKVKLQKKLLQKLKQHNHNKKVKWKLKKKSNQRKSKARNKKLLNITELAKLVKDFVLCLLENILVWLTKKLMLQEWSMSGVKNAVLNQKTKFLDPRNPRRSRKQKE